MIKIDRKTFINIIFFAVIFITILWIYNVEAEGNSCHIERRRQCESPKYAIDPQEGDTMPDLLQRLENHARLHEEKVIWRRSIIYAVIGATLFHLVIMQKVPSKLNYLVTIIIMYVFIYIMNQYFMMHFDLRASNRVIETIKKLRENLNISQRATAPDLRNDKFF